MSDAGASDEATGRPFPAGARCYRLSGPRAFEAVFRLGTRFEGRYLQLVAMPATQAIGRFGFVVGRKVVRRAVDRNRFRRLMREMLRSERARAVAFDLVLRLKRPVTASEMPQVVAEGLRLLHDADAARRAAA